MIRRSLGPMLLICCLVAPTTATAKEVAATQGPISMSTSCKKGGGTSIGDDGSGTYGCINKSGGIILCGGKTAEQKKTCTVALTPNDERDRLAERSSKIAGMHR